MANFVFDEASLQLQSGGTIAYGSDTLRWRLVASSVTPSRTSTSMTAYTKIGTDVALTTPTITKNTTDHRTIYSADNPTWTTPAAGSTIGYIVVFKFVTNDAGSTPIFLLDVPDTATNDLDISATIGATGINYLQA